jgi:hypothetical protein
MNTSAIVHFTWQGTKGSMQNGFIRWCGLGFQFEAACKPMQDEILKVIYA